MSCPPKLLKVVVVSDEINIFGISLQVSWVCSIYMICKPHYLQSMKLKFRKSCLCDTKRKTDKRTAKLTEVRENITANGILLVCYIARRENENLTTKRTEIKGIALVVSIFLSWAGRSEIVS